MDFHIGCLDNISERDAQSITALYRVLSPHKKRRFMRDDLLRKSWGKFVMVVARENGNIVGMASLTLNACSSKKWGTIEDVAVLERCQGKGLGKALTQQLIEIARAEKLEYLELTSKPERVAANALYQKLGFALIAKAWQEWNEEKKTMAWKGTNVYRLTL